MIENNGNIRACLGLAFYSFLNKNCSLVLSKKNFDFYVQRAPPLIINKDLLAWRATKAFYTLTQPLLILLASSWNIDQHGHFQAHSRWFLENSLQKGKEEAAWSRLLLFTWTATTPCKYFMGSSCCSIFLLSFNDI